MVVQHDGYSLAVGQIEQRVQAPEEVRVELILVARLRTGPDDTQAYGVPASCLDMGYVGFVECGARATVASGLALVVDDVVADAGAGDGWQIRRTLYHNVRPSQNDAGVCLRQHKPLPVYAHSAWCGSGGSDDAGASNAGGRHDHGCKSTCSDPHRRPRCGEEAARLQEYARGAKSNASSLLIVCSLPHTQQRQVAGSVNRRAGAAPGRRR